jgi:hypothetical protein
MTSLTEIEKRALSTFTYGERLNPVRDWLALVAVAFVLFLASIGVNVWIYERVSHGESVGASGSVSSTSDTAPIDAAEALFKKRAAEAEKYKSAYQFVDPSK